MPEPTDEERARALVAPNAASEEFVRLLAAAFHAVRAPLERELDTARRSLDDAAGARDDFKAQLAAAWAEIAKLRKEYADQWARLQLSEAEIARLTEERDEARRFSWETASRYKPPVHMQIELDHPENVTTLCKHRPLKYPLITSCPECLTIEVIELRGMERERDHAQATVAGLRKVLAKAHADHWQGHTYCKEGSGCYILDALSNATALTETHDQAVRAAAREEARRELREAVTLADSYLSLVYHRHLRKETVDTSLDLDLQKALGVLRKAADSFYIEERADNLRRLP